MANVVIFTGSSRINKKGQSLGYGPGSSISRPLGAYQIAAILRNKGYTVQVIDYYWHIINRPEKFVKIVRKYITPETLWVGWSNTFFEGSRLNDKGLYDPYVQQMQKAIGLTEKGITFIKEWCNSQNPNIKFVCGGAKSWRWSQQKFKFFDYFVTGYADATAVALTDFLAGKTKNLDTVDNLNGSKSINYDQKGQLFDFNNHKHVWHKTDHLGNGTALPIEISRGCIFRCSYCNFPLNGKKKMEYIRDANKIIDELNYNYENFGVTHYMYSDDTHNDSVDKLEFLYDNVYTKLDFKISFSTYLRLDLLCAHPHTIQLLKDSGLVGTFFGIESLNQNANKVIGKSAPTDKILDNLQMVRDIWKKDVIINVGLIIGLKNDSEATVREWLPKILNKDSPIDHAAIAPLQLLPVKDAEPHWQNNMELNTEKYGYTFDDNGVWTNNMGMSQYDAQRIAEEFNAYLVKEKGKIKHWFDPHRASALSLNLNQYYTYKYPELLNIEKEKIERYINDLLQ